MNKQLNNLIEVDRLIKVAYNNGYSLYNKQPLKNYNLNIWVIRAKDRVSGTFNDIEVIFWNDGIKWNIERYCVTSDPSDISLINRKNPLGTAIIRKGQYKSTWQLGFHKNRKDHIALIQVKPITVIRDFNKDNILDTSIPKYDFINTTNVNKYESCVNYYINTSYGSKLVYRLNTGLFGINNHRASKYSILNRVGLYSEGCIVHNDYKRYMNSFIDIIKKSVIDYGNLFTITIIDEDDLVSV